MGGAPILAAFRATGLPESGRRRLGAEGEVMAEESTDVVYTEEQPMRVAVVSDYI